MCLLRYSLISRWPNTYTFTKALTEDHIRSKNEGLPMGIFRPEIGNQNNNSQQY